MQQNRKAQQNRQKQQSKCYSFNSVNDKPAFVSQDRLRETFNRDADYFMNKNSGFQEPKTNYKAIEPSRNYVLQKDDNYIHVPQTVFPPVAKARMGRSEKKLFLGNEDRFQSLHRQDLDEIGMACQGKSKREKGRSKQTEHL